MNTIQFKYAIEVERTGSISQAAENLYMAQPNLSKAIRELEESLGFTVFERTPRGVRSNTVKPRLSSSSRMALLRLGCAMYRFSAACEIEPVRSTSMAYLNCIVFIQALRFNIYYIARRAGGQLKKTSEAVLPLRPGC